MSNCKDAVGLVSPLTTGFLWALAETAGAAAAELVLDLVCELLLLGMDVTWADAAVGMVLEAVTTS